MRKYFLTGGTGFIGRAIVRALLAKPDTAEIVCLTRGRQDLLKHEKLSYVFGDVTEAQLPGDRFTDCIHAAAEANDLLQPDQAKYYYTIVEGARRVFEWAHERGIYRTLFVSSGAVFKGDTIYCRAKRMSEWLVDRFLQQAKIARVYSVVGEEMPLNGQYALGQFIWGAVFDRCVRYYPGGSVRSYLNVEDAAQWLLVILDRGRPSVYDVGASRPISMSDLAQLVARIADVPVKQIPPKDERPSNIYLPDVIATKGLGVTETITLEDSIRRTIDHLRNTYVEPSRAA